jgi:hypothetical protein
VVYDLVPVNLDERLVTEAVIDDVHGCYIITDKVFISAEGQDQIFDHPKIVILINR